jgi:hypothetical protein
MSHQALACGVCVRAHIHPQDNCSLCFVGICPRRLNLLPSCLPLRMLTKGSLLVPTLPFTPPPAAAIRAFQVMIRDQEDAGSSASSRPSWASTCASSACAVFRVQAVTCTAARVLRHHRRRRAGCMARTPTRTHAHLRARLSGWCVICAPRT